MTSAAFEDALVSLEQTRVKLEGEKLEASKLLRDAEEDRKQALEVKNRLDLERERAAEIAKREAARILGDARKTADAVMEELRGLQRKAASDADWRRINEEKAELFRRLNEAESEISQAPQAEEENAPPTRLPVAGDKVRLRSLGTFADVISVRADGVLDLQAGIMKITARPDEVALVDAGAAPAVKEHIAKSEAKLRELTAKPELDLRGMTTDEAVPALERFIDSARMAKLNTVIVIHGKGTGAVRQAVHQCLRRERGIKSFRLGRYGEGEDGVTIVEL